MNITGDGLFHDRREEGRRTAPSHFSYPHGGEMGDREGQIDPYLRKNIYALKAMPQQSGLPKFNPSASQKGTPPEGYAPSYS
jgi:hypothetical protein